MKLTFLGATGTVTGSKYLLQADGRKVLIDCGLFQGLKELRLRNWAPLPVAINGIDAVLLTHAHLDHSGFLPRLVREGFKGPVYCSPATADLCRILLPDSGHIQEEDAESANRHGYSRHHPALPLYTEQEARDCLHLLKPVPYGQPQMLGDELTYTLHRAGHILGASFIRFEQAGTSILFSGDLGRPDDPITHTPAQIQDADIVLVESTYGNRQHQRADPLQLIGDVARRTIKRGGTLVIPAFAVGRAQSLLYYIHRLKAGNHIPDVPVYLDSPMSIDITELMHKHASEHRLSREECAAVCNTAICTRTPAESKAINENILPKIIISASGMATGGRVLHHLKFYVGNPRNTIMFAGYQAAGTRGERIIHGEKEVKIHGQMWPVKAEIVQLDNLSAHADRDELLNWLGHLSRPPKHVYVTHGEPEAAEALANAIRERFGWQASVPEYQQQVEF